MTKLAKLKEHHLWLWCLELAIIHEDGQLDAEQEAALKVMDFPFESYLKQAYEYMAKTEDVEGEGICHGQHILCVSGKCDEMRERFLAEMEEGQYE